MKTILVTGTDTGVGKTWVTCLLIRLLNDSGHKTGGYKPVCSGSELNSSGVPEWADVRAIHQSCLDSNRFGNLSDLMVCPQRFHAPVAPNVAAKLEGRAVDDQLLVAGVRSWGHDIDRVVVEGAGGLFCPMSDSTTVLDIAVQIQPAVVIVAANRLGVINHTRLTVDVLRQHRLNIAAIVLNDVKPDLSSNSDASCSSNAAQLFHWIPDIPLFTCGWNQTTLHCFSEQTLSIIDVLRQY